MMSEYLTGVYLPPMVKIRQLFEDNAMSAEDVRESLFSQLRTEEISNRIKPGMSVAVTVGSRGIDNISPITKTIVDFVKERGAVPFIVPAMGSHGGATAEGQADLIAGYGITEEAMGCRIRSSMETVVLGRAENGKPVYCDKHAAEADGIIVCGRVKLHTAFRGPYESGICKMMAVGLGKQKGAEVLHENGFGLMKDEVPMFAKVFLEKAPILMGIGLMENAHDHTSRIEVVPPEHILKREPELLIEAKSRMQRILFPGCDVLIVDRMGKNYSGDGMDPNVTGRFLTPHASGGISAQKVVVLDLAEQSHGSAHGVGLADVTTRRLVNKIDYEKTYANTITTTLIHASRIPMTMENDRDAIALALKSCHFIDRNAPRVIRIPNTLDIAEIEISESLLPEARSMEAIQILGEPEPFAFDEDGNLF